VLQIYYITTIPTRWDLYHTWRTAKSPDGIWRYARPPDYWMRSGGIKRENQGGLYRRHGNWNGAV